MRLICLALLPLGLAGEDTHRFAREVNGGVLAAGHVVAWGDGIEQVPLSGGPSRSIRGGRYDRGGCVFEGGLFLNEAAGDGESLGRAVYFFPDFKQSQLVDSHAAFSDCLGAELFGRSGVLVTHRQMQIRFYERPDRDGDRWPYREIYSIYTASAQGGLKLMDVNGDGRSDIIHGNYWVQSPEEFDHSWRIFAFNNWWDTPRSAMLRVAISGADIIAAESEGEPARIATFTRTSDPKQFWRESAMAIRGGIIKPRALAAHAGEVLVGEDKGEGSRLVAIKNGKVSVLGTSRGYLEIWPEEGIALTRNSIQRYRRR